jgi:hypothetical protein
VLTLMVVLVVVVEEVGVPVILGVQVVGVWADTPLYLCLQTAVHISALAWLCV